MDRIDALFRYGELLILIFFISMARSYVYLYFYQSSCSIICYELLIAFIVTQTYLFYIRHEGHIDSTNLVKLIAINLILTTIMWAFGTPEGLKALSGNPNIYHPM